MTDRKDTSARDARILALWNPDKPSISTTAERAGVHWDVAARVLRAHGLNTKPRGKTLPDTPERDVEARALRLAGASFRDIAIAVYGSRNAEHRVARRMRGLYPPVVAVEPVPTGRRMYGWEPLPALHPHALQVLRDAGAWV